MTSFLEVGAPFFILRIADCGFEIVGILVHFRHFRHLEFSMPYAFPNVQC
jgi:hypothetical protein